jgi:Rv0078B-related antitoxin
MEWISDPEDLARTQATFELYDFAERVMRQNLRRRFPRESEAEIETRLQAWLRKEPRERWDHP